MRKSLKIAIALVLLSVTLSAGFLAYGTMQAANVAKDNQNKTNPGNGPPDKSPPDDTSKVPKGKFFGFTADEWAEIMKHVTVVSVSGTVVSLFDGMLVLSTPEDHTVILLPENWTINQMVSRRETLFNGIFAAVGQNITVKALEGIIWMQDGFNVNVMVGFEIINSKGMQAFAIFPFNVETKP